MLFGKRTVRDRMAFTPEAGRHEVFTKLISNMYVLYERNIKKE